MNHVTKEILKNALDTIRPGGPPPPKESPKGAGTFVAVKLPAALPSPPVTGSYWNQPSSWLLRTGNLSQQQSYFEQ